MTPTIRIESLYRARRDVVELVDVPELGFVAVDGHGAPESEEFAAAVQAVYGVSYGAHFLLKKLSGSAPKVMLLEALWWMDDPAIRFDPARRDRWRWRVMIHQPEPVGEDVIRQAVELARQKASERVDRVRFLRWREGLCAQTLHIGSYAEEPATIARLHETITATGHRPRGRHHEIYLGDPRRAAPEKLRTILRQPVEPL